MIISTGMSSHKKDLDEKPIEPEVVNPSDEEIAETEISPPPEVSHPVAPESPHAIDTTAVVPVTALQQYLAEVRLHPYLSKEEELRLFHEYRTHGNRDAAVKLIMANLRVSISIAAEYLHTGADHMDLIQEGNVGLMHAIKKFDPTKNVRFYAYAAWWSRAYILRYLLNNYRLVKIGTTQDQRKLFYNLKREKAKLEREGFAPDTKLLADRLNVRERDVIEMGQRLGNWELSLDQPIGEDQEGSLLDVLPSQQVPADEQLAQTQLQTLFQPSSPNCQDTRRTGRRHPPESHTFRNSINLDELGSNTPSPRTNKATGSPHHQRLREYIKKEHQKISTTHEPNFAVPPSGFMAGKNFVIPPHWDEPEAITTSVSSGSGLRRLLEYRR